MTEMRVFVVVKRFFARVFTGSRGIFLRSMLGPNKEVDSSWELSRRFAKDLSGFFENSMTFR